jgi:tetratricopeptide (TPR) repeat protein
MKKMFIILNLLFLSAVIHAQIAEQLNIIEQANQLYSATDYEAAILKYESVVIAGYESSALFFNLGNAYFKVNNFPAAILYYEKARKLDPTDENIQFNLDLANSRIIDKMEPLPQFFLKAWWLSLRNAFTSDRWAKAGVFFFILVLAAAATFTIINSVARRKIAFWAGIILLLMMALSLISSFSSYKEYSSKSTAIVYTPTVTVKSSPSDSSVDLFVIHEGTKVSITDQVEEWSEVRLGNGSVGWVKNDTYRPI